MSDESSDDSPTRYSPTRPTARLFQDLKRHRQRIGMTQTDLGLEVFKRANETAERFGEPRRWKKPLTKASISAWENMWPERGEPTRRAMERRQSFSMFDFAIWNRALGLRAVVESVPADSDRVVQLLREEDAQLMGRINDLPDVYRSAVEELVYGLWVAHGESRDAVAPIPTWKSRK